MSAEPIDPPFHPTRPLAKVVGETDLRVTEFKRRAVEHSHLRASYRAVKSACGRARGENVVIVTGPTGVGKTTLARKLYRELRQDCEQEVQADKDVIPVVGLSAVPSHGRVFSWRDFFIRVLFQAKDPVTDRSLLARVGADLLGDTTIDTPADRMPPDKLRRACEETLRRRKTRWLIIDEAHHMLLSKDPKVNEAQFEALKSLAIETNVTIVLFGTYKLLDIRDQSGQLVRRSELIHFARYDAKCEEHQRDFLAALCALEKHFAMPQQPRLQPDVGRYFLKSVGCVGILKDWLTRVYESALNEGLATFDLDYALRFAHSNKALITIAKEASAGEAKLADVDEDELKALLTGDGQSSAQQPPESGEQPNDGDPSAGSTGEDPAKLTKSAGRPTARRVGQRLPKRDPSGGLADAA